HCNRQRPASSRAPALPLYTSSSSSSSSSKSSSSSSSSSPSSSSSSSQSKSSSSSSSGRLASNRLSMFRLLSAHTALRAFATSDATAQSQMIRLRVGFARKFLSK